MNHRAGISGVGLPADHDGDGRPANGYPWNAVIADRIEDTALPSRPRPWPPIAPTRTTKLMSQPAAGQRPGTAPSSPGSPRKSSGCASSIGPDLNHLSAGDIVSLDLLQSV